MVTRWLSTNGSSRRLSIIQQTRTTNSLATRVSWVNACFHSFLFNRWTARISSAAFSVYNGFIYGKKLTFTEALRVNKVTRQRGGWAFVSGSHAAFPVRDLCVAAGSGRRVQIGENEKWERGSGRWSSRRHNENLPRLFGNHILQVLCVVFACVRRVRARLAQSGPNQAFNAADHQYLIGIHLHRLLLLPFFSPPIHTCWGSSRFPLHYPNLLTQTANLLIQDQAGRSLTQRCFFFWLHEEHRLSHLQFNKQWPGKKKKKKPEKSKQPAFLNANETNHSIYKCLFTSPSVHAHRLQPLNSYSFSIFAAPSPGSSLWLGALWQGRGISCRINERGRVRTPARNRAYISACVYTRKTATENSAHGIMRQRASQRGRLNERDETETAAERCWAAKGQRQPPARVCVHGD